MASGIQKRPEDCEKLLRPIQESSVIGLLATRMPRTLQTRLADANPLFTYREWPRIAHSPALIWSLHVPDIQQVTECQRRLEKATRPGSPSINSLAPYEYAREGGGPITLCLPLWVLGYWATINNAKAAKKTWKAVVTHRKEISPTILEKLGRAPWALKFPPPLRADRSDLATLLTKEWLSDHHLDEIAAAANSALRKKLPLHGILRAACSQKLLQLWAYPSQREWYGKRNDTRHLHEAGDKLKKEHLNVVGVPVLVHAGSSKTLLPTQQKPGNHWVAIVVDVPNGSILYADPFGFPAPANLIEAFQWWLAEHGLVAPRREALAYCKQTDGFSCGILAMNSILHRLSPKDFPLIPAGTEAVNYRQRYMRDILDYLEETSDGNGRKFQPELSHSEVVQVSEDGGADRSTGDSTDAVKSIKVKKRKNDEVVCAQEAKKSRPLIEPPPKGDPIHTSMTLKKLRTDAGSCGGQEELPDEDLESLLQLGWGYISWTGDEGRAIVTPKGEVFGALAGRPSGDRYAEAVQEAKRAMEEVYASSDFASVEEDHKRGHFTAVNVGVGYGPGQKKAHNLAFGQKQWDQLDGLFSNPAMVYLAEAQDAMFRMWAPDMHEHYGKKVSELRKHKSFRDLRPNFEGVAWPTAALNLGGSVWTKRHFDVTNVGYGLCAITSLGNFDPTKGGHIVLPALELIIEFPPGAIILIPSAALEHANTPVGKKETRLSFTQYCPAGIEVEHADWLEFNRLKQEAKEHKRKGWSLFSNLRDL